MLRLIIFVVLVSVPIAEIAVILMVGSAIGALPTVALIILTAILGTVLLRRQGLSALTRLRADIKDGRVPAAAIGHAITVAVAGVLLLTPGFITDILGFTLFIPAVRSALWRQIVGSIRVERSGPGGPDGPARPRTHPRTIILEDDDYRPRDGASPWREDDR